MRSLVDGSVIMLAAMACIIVALARVLKGV